MSTPLAPLTSSSPSLFACLATMGMTLRGHDDGESFNLIVRDTAHLASTGIALNEWPGDRLLKATRGRLDEARQECSWSLTSDLLRHLPLSIIRTVPSRTFFEDCREK